MEVPDEQNPAELLKRIVALRQSLAGIKPGFKAADDSAATVNNFVEKAGALMDERS